MKKRLIEELNAKFIEQCIAAANEYFGIDLSMTYSIVENRFMHAWKSQGVKKDREIDYYLRGLEDGYRKALEVVTNFEISKTANNEIAAN